MKRQLLVLGLVTVLGILGTPGELLAQQEKGTSELYPIQVGRWYGYIDSTGSVRISPRFLCATNPNHGLMIVKLPGRNDLTEDAPPWIIDSVGWNLGRLPEILVLDENGQIALGVPQRIVEQPEQSFEYDNLCRDGKDWPLINGKFWFREGVSPPAAIDSMQIVSKPLEHLRDTYSFESYLPSEGFFVIGNREGNTYARIDGSLLLSPQFEDASDFSGGFAAVKLFGRWGVLDTLGHLVVEPRYATLSGFSEGLAVAGATSESPCSLLVEPSGKEYTFAPPIPNARSCVPFHNGFARIENGRGEKFFVDKRGRVRFSTANPCVQEFQEGLAVFCVVEGRDDAHLRGGKFLYGYGNADGKVVIPPQFIEAAPFQRGLAQVVTSDGRRAYVNKANKIVWKEPLLR